MLIWILSPHGGLIGRGVCGVILCGSTAGGANEVMVIPDGKTPICRTLVLTLVPEVPVTCTW